MRKALDEARKAGNFKDFAETWAMKASEAKPPTRARSVREVYARAEDKELYTPGSWSEVAALKYQGLISEAEYDQMVSIVGD